MTTASPANQSWQAIAADLRRQLDAGEYQAGSWLPPRRDLMDLYGAADRTIARALHQLRDDGYLIARSTAGWIVRGQRSVVRSTRNRLSRNERSAGRGAFVTDCHAAGLIPTVRNEVRVEASTEAVADALHIEHGAPVCVRDRVMAADNEVLQLATSYLPRNITKGTQIEDDNSGPGGIYARLEELGYELSSYTERVSIGRADEQEAKQMNISPGEPVYRLWRTAWSSETPVEVNNITITGNRYELVYELPAN
ncbi:GntR family transcriptional regulator [Pseudonocardia sp. ICBG1293]|uniref:GntR family transcriptional regulator n=1 Tax=Pseudonocardia sp. ICBG1293 TaxID=2844382 RepID=UPI001CC97A9B|nr:GntR family transcriptional regulator [Pseudonocardia sp. ICBG1293]